MVRRAQAHSNGAGVVPRVAGRRVGEGRQNHPAAGYSHPLDEATDCDGVPPSTISSSYFSTSCSCSSAVVVPSLPVPPSPVPTRHLLPSLCRLLRVYRTALANLELGRVMHPLEWYVLPSSPTWRISEQRESRAFCLNRSVGPTIFRRRFHDQYSLRKIIIRYVECNLSRTILPCSLDSLLF